MRSRRLGATLLVAVAGLAACGDPVGPPPEPVGIIGSYALRTVDGHEVPHETAGAAPGGRIEVMSGEARMGAGGVCTIGFVVRLVTILGPGPAQDVEYECSYEADDPSARETAVRILVEGADEPSEGTYRDGRLTFTFPDGQDLAFER